MKSCEAFALNGADVKLIVPTGSAPVKGDPFEYYSVKKNFSIKKAFSVNLKFFSEKAKFYIRTLSFAFFSVLYFLLNARGSVAYSRDWAPLLFLSLAGVKPVAEIHDYRHSKPRKIIRFILRRARKIVVNSEGTRNAISGIYDIADDKILIAPNGVDCDFFNIPENKIEARNKLGIPLEGEIIAYIGRMDTIGEEKGVPNLIKAFSLMENKDARLFIVGGPSHYVEKYKRDSAGIPNVTFTGQVEYKKIPLYLRAMDVLVVPSPKNQHSKTTSPIKLFEYMAAGKVIVASDLPSFRAYLNESNAIFFEPENAEELAQKLDIILKNNDAAKKIAEKSFFDSREYSWFNRAKKIADFIV